MGVPSAETIWVRDFMAFSLVLNEAGIASRPLVGAAGSTSTSERPIVSWRGVSGRGDPVELQASGDRVWPWPPSAKAPGSVAGRIDGACPQIPGPAGQVTLLGGAVGAPGRFAEGLGGAQGVAGHVQQVPAHGEKEVMSGNALVGLDRGEQVEAGAGTVHHRRRHSPVHGRHGSGRYPVEGLIEGQHLGPVGLLGAGRLVVDGCDEAASTEETDW